MKPCITSAAVHVAEMQTKVRRVHGARTNGLHSPAQTCVRGGRWRKSRHVQPRNAT